MNINYFQALLLAWLAFGVLSSINTQAKSKFAPFLGVFIALLLHALFFWVLKKSGAFSTLF
jgi:uncharacterized membrane protein YjgN (DUF898 family)